MLKRTRGSPEKLCWVRMIEGRVEASPETMVERRVTYTLDVQGKLVVVENVPARVCLETGDQFFSPETVEKLQQMAWGRLEANDPDACVRFFGLIICL